MLWDKIALLLTDKWLLENKLPYTCRSYGLYYDHASNKTTIYVLKSRSIGFSEMTYNNLNCDCIAYVPDHGLFYAASNNNKYFLGNRIEVEDVYSEIYNLLSANEQMYFMTDILSKYE